MKQPGCFELGKLITDIVKSCNHQLRLTNIHLQVIDDRTSSLILKEDLNRLKELFHTVLCATITHSGASHIRFTTRQLFRTTKEVYLECSVEDNGFICDGSPHYRYFRSLVEARRLIRSFHGKCHLSALQGTNTVFSFIIKCNWQPFILMSPGLLLLKKTFSGKRILLAEDNEMNQKSIGELLANEFIEVDIVSNGREAIELFEKKGGYDLVLLDLHMPFMNGSETAHYIRKTLRSAVPILIMSPFAEDHHLSEGNDHYIRKPFSLTKLADKMQWCVRSPHLTSPEGEELAATPINSVFHVM